MTIRYSHPDDRQPILEFVEATGFFRPGEIEIAAEVLDEALEEGPTGHYQSFTAVDHDGHPVGWVCFGPTPCTLGTFDIYWIAVDARRQGRGWGKALMAHAEKLIAERSGRLIVVETSSTTEYGPARSFYQRNRYEQLGRIRDYYRVNDDLVIYGKYL